MELQFKKTDINYLQPLKCFVQNQEQTQEIRLDDTMSQAEKVLGAWGQVILRGKQWHSGSVQVSGGVMAWVLYEPEEGPAQSVQTWVPFQTKMDIPHSEQDGRFLFNPMLRSVDARIVNGRKLLVRVDLGLQLCAWVPQTAGVYRPEELPEDVQVLRQTYPVRLPMETGEKEFAIDEILSLPGSCPVVQKLVCYRLHPELIDRKVMADKVVFRGCGLLHLLYEGTDGQLYSWDFELPFSQYADLSGQYEQDASAGIIPAITSLELEQSPDGKLLLKAGLIGQFVIYDRMELTVAEDAYSTRRALSPNKEMLQLPVVLDMQTQSMHCEQTVPMAGTRIVDVAYLPDQPAPLHQENQVEIDLAGQFQMLCSDSQGRLEIASTGWAEQLAVAADTDCQVRVFGTISGTPAGVLSGQSATLRADMLLDMVTMTEQEIPMITGIELEEREEKPGDRPSVILRKPQGNSLWEIAKQTGSTVEAIEKANGLTEKPMEEQMLLIPVV